MKNSTYKNINIILLDDHELVLQSINSFLLKEEQFNILSVHTKSSDLLHALQYNRPLPDVLVTDYELMPNENDGVNLIKTIKRKYPSINIIVMSSYFNIGTVGITLQAGAKGFVGKQQSLDDLIKAIKTVSKGKIYLESDVADQLALQKGIACKTSTSSSSYKEDAMRDIVVKVELTTREREVVRCLISGMSVSEIASKFSRSIKTISTQKVNAMKKLGVNCDSELHKLFLKNEGSL
ncbi:response regulator transcription factor [Vibrio diabolicus]|uniref:response regulator transcription factor n=1 Tax=Vibrio diabolicus TaxID=50719 RepID=UPI002160A688|nr:response regulator transcription factor [Vibrio diabolicus]MCS0309012.1 response regulator transcription factor [Vibrio diabolicus]